MSEVNTSERLRAKVSINIDQAALNEVRGKTVLLKYGGNAMLDEDLKYGVVKDVCLMKKLGVTPVIVHGGGPFIKSMLDKVGIVSEFVEGHRKTDSESITYVEMVLKGQVNSEIVKLINEFGYRAVGLSGKDGNLVKAVQRKHIESKDGKDKEVDLGHVGDVKSIDPSLVFSLIENDYIPVIAPIGVGETDQKDYNINADMFAGHMAGAVKAAKYLALTDVDGLMKDKDDPSTLIRSLTAKKAKANFGKIIQGGMIPKVESCLIALGKGVSTAHIINGTKKHTILQELLTKERAGTLIK